MAALSEKSRADSPEFIFVGDHRAIDFANTLSISFQIMVTVMATHADELSAAAYCRTGRPFSSSTVGNRSAYQSVWTGPQANGTARERKRCARRKADHKALCPDRCRRRYQAMEFASDTFIWEGTFSVTGW